MQFKKSKIYQAKKISYKVQVRQFSITIQLIKTSCTCSKVLLDSKLVRFHALFLMLLGQFGSSGNELVAPNMSSY